MTPAAEAIERLANYRRVAQEIRRRHEETLGVRLSRLIHLHRRAHQEPDPFIREQAELVVYAQATFLLEAEESIPRSTDRVEGAARRMRAEGLTVCPLCERALHDVGDFAFWAALRSAEIERLRALEAEGTS